MARTKTAASVGSASSRSTKSSSPMRRLFVKSVSLGVMNVMQLTTSNHTPMYLNCLETSYILLLGLRATRGASTGTRRKNTKDSWRRVINGRRKEMYGRKQPQR